MGTFENDQMTTTVQSVDVDKFSLSIVVLFVF